VINLQQSGFETPLLDGHGGGPNLGRVLPKTFFTFRAICEPSNGGQATIWLNESTPEEGTAFVTNATYGSAFDWGTKTGIGGNDRRMVKVGLRHEDDTTIWMDHVSLYQGAVPPIPAGPCDQWQPVVFDTTGPSGPKDQLVDQIDLNVFTTECYTGPTPAAGVFDSLSQKCKCMDRNNDEAVDQEDFGFFQRCYTGTSGPLSPDCDD
jgi:hypothetical protein